MDDLKATQIAIAPDGMLYCTTPPGKVYFFDRHRCGWVALPMSKCVDQEAFACPD